MTSNKNSTRYYSSKQEHKVAKIIKGKIVANSGAASFVGGDVQNDNILVECKTCIQEKKSFSIKREWLDKIEEEAFAMNKPYSALAFNFGEDTDNYYILNEREFKLFMEYIDSFNKTEVED